MRLLLKIPPSRIDPTNANNMYRKSLVIGARRVEAEIKRRRDNNAINENAMLLKGSKDLLNVLGFSEHHLPLHQTPGMTLTSPEQSSNPDATSSKLSHGLE